MARGQIWQNFPKLLRFMALFPSLEKCFIPKQKSQGEKPPKIRKKSSQEQSSWETFGPPPTEKTEKNRQNQGNIGPKSSWEPPFPGICSFSWAVFLPPTKSEKKSSENAPKRARKMCKPCSVAAEVFHRRPYQRQISLLEALSPVSPNRVAP